MFSINELTPTDTQWDFRSSGQLNGFPTPDDSSPNHPLRLLTDAELVSAVSYLKLTGPITDINDITHDDLIRLLNLALSRGWGDAYLEGRQVVLSSGKESDFSANAPTDTPPEAAQVYLDICVDRSSTASIRGLLSKVVPFDTVEVTQLEYLGCNVLNGLVPHDDPVGGLLRQPITGNARERVYRSPDGVFGFSLNLETGNLTINTTEAKGTMRFLVTYRITKTLSR